MEESFPRGGVQKKEARKHKDRDLFQDGKTKKKKKSGKEKKGGRDGKGVDNKKKQKVEDDVSLGQQQPQFLSRKTLYPGMLMLGYVKQIKNYELIIALPNGLSGTVPITNISQTYTERLQTFSEGDSDNTENVSTLSELFKVGMVIPCKLMNFDTLGGSNSKVIPLSINPADVNGDISSSSLKDRMCIYGSVSSQEDHGYILDIGVKGVQTFLRNKQAAKYVQMYNNGNPLRVGQFVMCKIQMKGDRNVVPASQNRVINVTLEPEKMKIMETVDCPDIPFTSLVPGTRVSAAVEKVFKGDGIVVEFNKFQGLIHKTHLPKAPSSYSPGDKVTCSILYIHPLVKTITMTMLPHLADYAGVPTGLFGKVRVGQTIEEATVLRTEKNQCVFFDIQNDLTAFAGVNNLRDEKVDNLQKEFKKGSVHRCRVLGFYPMEALVIVTLKKSVLEEKHMRISDIHPGEMIECKVKNLQEKGIEVEVCKGIYGFIPKLHLAEVTLTHPEQKFKPGDKLKCRVLDVNKKRSKVMLTHKKSMINSIGPRPLLSTEYIQYPEKVFYKGQVVRCKVVTVQPTSKKLTVTFVLEGKIDRGQTRKEMPADFKVGKRVKCKVVKKIESGLDVELLSSKARAFLPKMHLSDSMEMCDALWDMYQPDDIIEPAIYWHKSKVPLLTCKPCLLSAADNEEELITAFDSLVPGIMLPGTIKNVMTYGIFVEFANGLFGLVPNQYAFDQRVADIKAFYPLGKTVVAKVVEVDKEKQRFLASLRMQDCYHGNTDIGIELTLDLLKEREWLLERLAQKQDKKGQLCQVKFGSIQKATVLQLADQGAICGLENGVKAVAVTDHLSRDASVGDEVNCVVLYVDLKQNCVEVSLDRKLVPYVLKRTEKDSTSVARVGQMLKSTVLLIQEDFVVVKLTTSHAKGQLAYLPAKRHWNDVLERHQYTVGQENKVVVKRIEGDVIIASLKVHEDRQEEEEHITPSHSHKLRIGDICTATVRKVYIDQIYIDMSGTRGRVHATEMFDRVEHSTCLTSTYKPGQEVKVRVVGFRDGVSKRYLPITHPKVKKSMPECTMKPSLLSAVEVPKYYTTSNAKRFKVGDKVVVFLDCYSCKHLHATVSPTVKGKVHLLNMSDNVEWLNKPGSHFKKGQCYNATVTNIVNDRLVDLSLLENPLDEIGVGKETRGIITCIKKQYGLVVQLCDKIRGSLDITDISDAYRDQPTDAFKHGEIITARVVELNQEKKRAVLSLRPWSSSRWPVDKRIKSVTDLSRGQVVRGFITHVSAKDVTVRIGVDVQIVVPMSRIAEGQIVVSNMMKKLFPVGDILKVKFHGFDKNNKAEVTVFGDGNQRFEIPTNFLTSSPSSCKKSKPKRKRSISNTSADSDSGTAKKLKNTETTSEIDESIELEIDGLDSVEDSSERDSTVSSLISETKGGDTAAQVDKNWTNFKISVQVKGNANEQMVHEEREVVETNDTIHKKEVSDSSDDGSVLWSEKDGFESSSESDAENSDMHSGMNISVSVTKDGKERKVVKEETENKSESDSDSEVEGDSDNTDSEEETEDDSDDVEELVDSKPSVTVKAEETVQSAAIVSKKNSQTEKERKRTHSDSKDEELLKKKKKDAVEEIKVKVVPKSDVKTSEKPVLEISDGFSWDTDFMLPRQQTGEISSDESEDEGQEKRVKKTKEQLRLERKEEEQRLYQSEMQRLEGDVQPETADDFDRLVLESPDSSLVWLRYMAFHLETTEIDKARAVAERALKTISFREEQEKLNVWVAYLNLENMYGTAESLRKVLVRAAQQNDQISVYLQMINIYVKSGKTEDGEQLFNSLVKKHSADKDLWIKFGEFYFQQGRFESARKLLQRCLKSLEMKHHVNTIIKFAQMEFKYGEPERGKTMFENTLSTYPNRTDLWSVYIDMVTKLQDLDLVRSIFTRVISNKMSTKKMKFFYKKYLEFEEKYGTADHVADVKKKALQYVESKGFVDE